MESALILFEDNLVRNFYPITLMRPGLDLQLGPLSLLNWAKAILNPHSVQAYVRGYLRASVTSRHPNLEVNREEDLDSHEDVVLMNCMANPLSLKTSYLRKGYWCVLSSSGHLIAAKLRARDLSQVVIRGIPSISRVLRLHYLTRTEENSNSSLLTFPWDILDLSPSAISAAVRGRNNSWERSLRNHAIIDQEKEVKSAGSNNNVEPSVVLDTRKGPIIFHENVTIEAFSRIEGPCFIGKDSKVRAGSSIRGSSIGQSCIIGGEVEGSVIHGYSNKAHAGYLGDSIVGSWVNIGAMTTNSNLKNTYGQVKVRVGRRKVNTGRQKFGCIIGDHAKTSIGSFLSSIQVGVSSHIYGRSMVDIPSFTIYAKSFGKRKVELDLDSACRTQGRMMQRRGIQQTRPEVDLLRKVFAITGPERLKSNVRPGKFSI